MITSSEVLCLKSQIVAGSSEELTNCCEQHTFAFGMLKLENPMDALTSVKCSDGESEVRKRWRFRLQRDDLFSIS